MWILITSTLLTLLLGAFGVAKYIKKHQLKHVTFDKNAPIRTNENEVSLPVDGSSVWAGFDVSALVMPSGLRCSMKYIGQPPHGDSYHSMSIGYKKIPGYIWGGSFSCSEDSKFLLCDWMGKEFDRATILIDIVNHRFLEVPSSKNFPYNKKL